MFSKLLVIIMILKQSICEPDRRVLTSLKYSNYYVKPTIVSGEPAETGQVPYLVSIKEPVLTLSSGRIVWKNLCGGSIITALKVLTAAHCFDGNNYFYKNNPAILRLVAGDLRTEITHSGNTETNDFSQWRKIREVILHPRYNFPSNDIAVAATDVPFIFTHNVDYVITASRNTDYPHSCISAGFGRTGHKLSSVVSPILLVTRINTLTAWKCSMVWEMNMKTFICSDSSVSDVARGDSGGPLACKGTSDPKEQPNRDLLVGVVSGKNFDKTSLYTRVSAYKDWIARNEGNALTIRCNFLVIAFLVLIYKLFFLKFFLLKPARIK